MTMSGSVFHTGELEMQRRAGALERMAQIGPKVIRDYMPQQHRDFFSSLTFLLLGAVDGSGQPWATALAGGVGLVQSPDERTLRVQAPVDPGDPVLRVLKHGAPIGILGIEPQTRRRNRVNGHVRARRQPGFDVAVDLSFGNCPKYIQAREPASLARGGTRSPQDAEVLAGLDAPALDLIRHADTFFIATAHPSAMRDDASPPQGVDVSHRGGKAGFVSVQGHTLTVPDFVGNFYFNTLGNLLVEPRCGLLFIDFGRGDLLHLTAAGEVLHEADAPKCYAGAQRLVRFHVSGGLYRRGALPLTWSAPQLSPHLEGTGGWR